MHFFEIVLGFIITLQVHAHRNPVPSPGMADGSTFPCRPTQSQRRIYDCSGFHLQSHQGEGLLWLHTHSGSRQLDYVFLSEHCKTWTTAANEHTLESSHSTSYSSTEEELQTGLPQSDFEWIFTLSWSPHASGGLPPRLGSEASI